MADRVIEGEPAVFAARIRGQGCRIDDGAQAQGQDLTGWSEARVLAGDEFSQVGRERLGLAPGEDLRLCFERPQVI